MTVIWGLIGVGVTNVTLNQNRMVALAAGVAAALVGGALVRARAADRGG